MAQLADWLRDEGSAVNVLVHLAGGVVPQVDLQSKRYLSHGACSRQGSPGHPRGIDWKLLIRVGC